MPETKMPHSQHDKHLCYLNNLEFQKNNQKEYKELVKNAQHYCENCGRAAASEKNLCKPIKL
jgi:hypothetical protein